jgi:hypothetical protein
VSMPRAFNLTLRFGGVVGGGVGGVRWGSVGVGGGVGGLRWGGRWRSVGWWVWSTSW